MPYLTTGSTELKAVNQILASVGQAPVTTLTTEETLVLGEVDRFTGYINGTTLFTSKDDLAQGDYISGVGVEVNTSIATARVDFTPNASAAGTTLTSASAFIPKGVTISSSTITTPVIVESGPTAAGANFTYTISATTTAAAADLTLSPAYYNHTLNINHTTPVGNTVTQSTLTESSVTSRVETQTNPDVAIALNTLLDVSREVQSEGWSFNKEFDYPLTPNSDDEILIADDVLQMDLNRNQRAENIGKYSVNRGGKLYDKKAHSYKWTSDTVYVDITWYFSWENIPQPIQAYIVARAAAIVSSRIIGDGNQYQMLQQKEAYARSMALEYECNQEDLSFFGSPKSGNYYQPYKPFHTLSR